MASISKDDYQAVSFATKKVYDFLKNEPDNTQKRIEAIKHIESVLDVLKKHREKFASDDLKFSSVNKAFQHLADLTGKRVKIAVEEANLKDNKRFIDAYIEAMLWSSNDDSNEQGGEPLDKNYDENDLSPELLKKIKEDCIKFIKENYPYIEADMLGAGHDFWLTQNGHGAGFWDGDWEFEIEGKNAGKHLTDASKKYGEVNVYVGDDGKIYGA